MRQFFRSFLGQASISRIQPSTFFNVSLTDLGASDSRLSGIFMPTSEVGEEKFGLSEQFLANADLYHSRYSASDDSTMLLRNALAESGWKPPSSPVILDVGTGSGANSVIPCLRVFENCRILATDLSPDLLAILQLYLRQKSLDHRVACVCTDSMKNHFKPDQFDLVYGSAILHHLIDPTVALKAAFSALKPGGVAMFIEPFEGFSLIGSVFQRILDEENSSDRRITDEGRNFFKAICTDLAARKGIDKSDIRFKYMDDKWLFTRTYFQDAAKRIGYRDMTIVPYLTPDSSRHYHSSVEILIRCSGLDPKAIMPDWAWAYIAQLDDSFSPEMKKDALLEGTVVFHK